MAKHKNKSEFEGKYFELTEHAAANSFLVLSKKKIEWGNDKFTYQYSFDEDEAWNIYENMKKDNEMVLVAKILNRKKVNK